VTSLLLLREIWVSGVREYLGNQQIAVPVAASGKMKTGLQLVGLSCVLASSAWGSAMWRDTLHISGIACLWSAVAFGAWSARAYTRALFKR
jgi:cardiolipin synthase (CMP-forming)